MDCFGAPQDILATQTSDQRSHFLADGWTASFQRYLRHLPRKNRDSYWSGIEILYQPYFAYEEVLSVFAEKRHQRASMLSSLEALTGRLSDGAVKELKEMREQDRLKGFDLFRRVPRRAESSLGRGSVFISFPYDDLDTVEPVATKLRDHLGDAVWWDRSGLSPGDDWSQVIDSAMKQAKVVLAFFGPGWATRHAPKYFERQIAAILDRSIPVVPVLVGDLRVSEWAAAAEKLEIERITRRQSIRLTKDIQSDVEELTSAVRQILARTSEESQSIIEDPDDPQKGKWGGKSSVDGRALSAEVRSISDDWFGVTLLVTGTPDKLLEGSVEFHLHPTFARPIVTVDVAKGRARLEVSAWGAFTVGATTDGGRTMLELDLSQNQSFPEKFRSR